jgi:hypothetical protein
VQIENWSLPIVHWQLKTLLNCQLQILNFQFSIAFKGALPARRPDQV